MDDRTHRAAHRIEGRSAAPGIAVGPLVRLAPVKHDARQSRSAAEERQALVDALAASQADLISLAHEAGDDEAEAILAFQIALVEDDNLTAPAFASIAGGEAANRAWSAAIDSEITSYEGASDPYFRARASDSREVARRANDCGSRRRSPRRWHGRSARWGCGAFGCQSRQRYENQLLSAPCRAVGRSASGCFIQRACGDRHR